MRIIAFRCQSCGGPFDKPPGTYGFMTCVHCSAVNMYDLADQRFVKEIQINDPEYARYLDWEEVKRIENQKRIPVNAANIYDQSVALRELLKQNSVPTPPVRQVVFEQHQNTYTVDPVVTEDDLLGCVKYIGWLFGGVLLITFLTLWTTWSSIIVWAVISYGFARHVFKGHHKSPASQGLWAVVSAISGGATLCLTLLASGGYFQKEPQMLLAVSTFVYVCVYTFVMWCTEVLKEKHE